MIIEDFLSWVRTAPVTKRAQAVNALGRAFLYSEMSYQDAMTAEAAMTVLLEDPSSTVRFALADALASSKKAPRHIIMALATDTSEIATMILARSPVLMDGELVDLVASGTVEQQIAIACRGHISSAICGALGEVGVVEACLGLLMNKAARRSKKIMHRIAQRHGTNAEIRKLMLNDEELDADVRLLLMEKLGEKLGDFVAAKNWLSKPRAEKSIRDTLDRSSIIYAAKSSQPDVDKLVDSMIKSERLTTAYLLRAICMGNITLFCTALGRLSEIPAERIEAMISQKGHSAFRAAFIKSEMPSQAFEVFSTALNVWQDLLSEPEWISRARMPYLVTRQLLGNYQGDKNEVVDELLLLLQRISSDMARDEAKTHVQELERKRADVLAAIASADSYQPLEKAIEAEYLLDIDPNEVDDQFELEFEASIVQALEGDVIEISANDMRIPEKADNDRVIFSDEAQSIDDLDEYLMSDAA